ncbi:hypothetical protein GIB67_031353 [Kingdonia uniflora]|uniref:Peroxidase n=1 Tax=Kingdonia uniflora TaxID=39325 RepID=A0A7J7P6J6_9MAGN|nr:hypothetical protein GIB67_031353 [Kingdonia uniflora]
MSSKGVLIMFLCFIVVVTCLSVKSEAQLQVGFYGSTCRNAELIVYQEVRKGFLNNKGIAAGLLRLHFHDCFVRGCDGSVLIDSTSDNVAEKDSPANNPSLRGFDIIDNAKARLESVCKGVVSCADIVAFAARDSVVLTRGIGYKVPAGRRDGRVSLVLDTPTNLPFPTSNLDALTKLFKSKGLTQEEMITLSGSHTIGRSHCTAFSKRLYNFSSTTPQDPSLDPAYAAILKKQCPPGNNPDLVVQMNPSSPNTFDSGYYTDILKSRGLLTSDQTLNSTTNTANQVKCNAFEPYQWKKKFAAAMVKMGKLDVLTGTAGEIRLKCRVPN